MTEIPNILSPAIAVYLHMFVEWDIEKNIYISVFNKETTKLKQAELQDIILLGGNTIELEFLNFIEEDPRAKKMLRKAINIWKDKYP